MKTLKTLKFSIIYSLIEKHKFRRKDVEDFETELHKLQVLMTWTSKVWRCEPDRTSHIHIYSGSYPESSFYFFFPEFFLKLRKPRIRKQEREKERERKHISKRFLEKQTSAWESQLFFRDSKKKKYRSDRSKKSSDTTCFTQNKHV